MYTKIALLLISSMTGTALLSISREGPKRKDKKLIVVKNMSFGTKNLPGKSVYQQSLSTQVELVQ